MRRSVLAILIFIPSLLPSFGFAQYYKCVQTDGRTAFQDTPCAASATTKIIPTQESKDHSDPIKAAAAIGATAHTILRAAQWCQFNYPPAHESIVEARNRWLERHDKLITKGKQILAEKFTADERRALATISVRETNLIITALEREGTEKFKAWCTGMPQKMLSPEMNLNSKLVLVNTINSYKLADIGATK